MKRISIISVLFLLLTLSLNAQNIVSTSPSNRKVIVEEFTGVYCQNCPQGHKVANTLMETYPDNVYAVNIHAGNYATTSKPNFTTTDGNTIHSGFGINGYPSGLVNRTTPSTLARGNWSLNAKQEMAKVADCNIAGQVVIDKESRKATITVEVYYTSNSASETNYLNVIMLQDDIYALQNNLGTWVEEYHHMHAFRDAITSSWGDAISPTTAGTLITKTYTYDIPQRIGGSNGFDVKLDDIEFLAFVTEKYQSETISNKVFEAVRPVLNVNKLHTIFMSSDAIHPSILSLGVTSADLCSNNKIVNVVVNNNGLNELTSLKLEVSIDNGEPIEKTWEGSILSSQTLKIDVDANILKGKHVVNVKIVEANGEKYEDEQSQTVDIDAFAEFKTSSEEAEMTIELMQDKYGSQITWELLSSDNLVLASGGPYENLSGTPATKLHEIKVNVPVGECVKFVIKDSKGNGICCQYGEGYYKILNSKGKVIVNGDGDYGAESVCRVSIVEGEEEEPSALSAPTDVIAMTLNETELVVMWDAVEGADSYNVYNQDKLVATSKELSTVVSGLKPGREYCFTVTASDRNGESEKSDKACATTKGEYNEEDGESIEELTSSFRIYPNPVNDMLYIVAEVEVEEVVVYDVYGRQQVNKTTRQQDNEMTVDVAGLNGGIYFVRIKTVDGIITKRFVKE